MMLTKSVSKIFAMLIKFFSMVFNSFPAICKYYGIANIGGSVVCFFEYGFQPFVFVYMFLSICVCGMGLILPRMVDGD